MPGGTIRLRHGGSGPPLLLLHGNPQIALRCGISSRPALAKRFTVVCPDLRGYGKSLKPPATPDHAPYAKREMAKRHGRGDGSFRPRRFRLAGHDRGGRVAHRLALDFPDRVERLAVLDIIPTLEHFERANMEFALGYYHWFWFAQPHPFPEVLIDAAPETWFHYHTRARRGRPICSIRRRWPTTSRRAPARRTSAACARTIAPPPPSTWSTTAPAAPPA